MLFDTRISAIYETRSTSLRACHAHLRQLACQAQSSPTCTATAADTQQVVHAMEAMYRTLTVDDVPGVKAAFSQDG